MNIPRNIGVIALLGTTVPCIGQSWGWLRYPGSTGTDQASSVTSDAAGNVFAAGAFQRTIHFGTDSLVSAGPSSTVDMWVAKYDMFGDLAWVRRFGGDENDRVERIRADASGNCYLLAYYQGTVDVDGTMMTGADSTWTGGTMVIKLDPNGDVLWVRSVTHNSTNDGFVGDMAVSPAGFIQVQAPFEQNAFNSVDSLERWDTDGNTIWQQDTVSTGALWAAALAIDADGNTYSAEGTDILKYDPSGQVLFQSTFPITPDGDVLFHDVSVDVDHNIFVTGSLRGTYTIAGTSYTSSGHNDVMVMKLDPSGQPLWVRLGGGDATITSHEEGGWSIVVDPTGAVLVAACGYYTVTFGGITIPDLNNANGQSTYVLKYDTNGALQWVLPSGYDMQKDIPFDMDLGTNDDLYVAGRIYVTGATNYYFGGTQVIYNGGNGGSDAFVTIVGDISTHVPEGAYTEGSPVFPNPVLEQLSVTGTSDGGRIDIYNALGERVLSTPVRGQTTTIRINGLPSGPYLLDHVDGHRHDCQRFIKE